MTHKHYYRVQANTHFELGFKLARLFKESFLEKYSSYIKGKLSDSQTVLAAEPYLKLTNNSFPHLIEELKGYAKGLEIDFPLFWALYLQDDLNMNVEKCTSCFSSDGLIIGHNEDNLDFLDEKIALVEKTIKDQTIFELHYYNSLGGDACSINSHGVVQTINTLHHTDQQIGVPRNVIARWLSETLDPTLDFRLIKSLQRSRGYNHTFSDLSGAVMNIESSANETRLVHPTLPFVHTNHYLTDLSNKEDTSHSGNSKERLTYASDRMSAIKTPQDMMKLLEDISRLASNDTRESKTIGRMVFDLKKKEVWCWLQRERELGWINYPILFL